MSSTDVDIIKSLLLTFILTGKHRDAMYYSSWWLLHNCPLWQSGQWVIARGHDERDTAIAHLNRIIELTEISDGVAT